MNRINETIMELSSKEGWYDACRVIKAYPDANIYFIVGARRIGKTLFYIRLACELYNKYGVQTMWVRNKKVELEDDGFISDFLNGPKHFGWCPEKWICRKDGVYDGEHKVILFQSISTFSNRRGNMTPDVDMIVFDEFMPEDRKYPRHAHTGLMSLTKTVLSGKEDARCFCLSNFISSANPYFVGFRIYPEKGKDVTVYKDKGIAIEVCHGYKTSIEEDNPWNKVYNAGGYQDYASEEEDKLYELVCRVPNGSTPAPYVLKIDGNHYRAFLKKNTLYFDDYRGSTNGLSIYTPNIQECGNNVNLVIPMMRNMIRENMAANSLRFKSPNVMYAILSMIYDAI